jgi:aminopeptidase N
MKPIFCILIFLICTEPLYTQNAPEHFARDRSYDVLHYKLNIAVDIKNKTCSGEVNIKLVPLRMNIDEIQLDAGEMEIKNLRLGMKGLDYEHKEDTLIVKLDKMYSFTDTLNIAISYSVKSPKKGLYFITPDSGYPNKQYQVWSQGAAEDNHYWFPCYDFPNDRSTSEMIITVDDKYTAISNGKLIEIKKDNNNKTTTYHWFEGKTHPSYLISLIVGEYVELKDSSDNVPISNYVYKYQQSDAYRSFGKTPKMINFFSQKIGYPYPWEKFGQAVVSDFIYGGMENVSIVTLTDYTIHDSRAHLDYSSDGLVAHELAHQWFGDLLTCKDWSHAWLNEGFATYFENLFREYDLGKDDAAKEILDAQIVLRNIDQDEKRRPMVCNRYNYPMDLFDTRIYGKGAVVLNMLRYFLGDGLFWKAINHYVNKYAFQCVETNDFKVAIEEATGYNLYWFFDQWVYKSGCPTFDVVTKWDKSSQKVYVTIRQTQKIDSLTGIFKTPIDIQIWTNGIPETYKVMVEKAEETFSFPSYREPDLVIFDKGSKILKRINQEKTISEWIFQLEHAEDGVDRLIAIDELQWYHDSMNVLLSLSKAALDDPFWAVRQEAVWALGDAKKSEIAETLILAYGDHDSRVRSACVGALGNFKGEKVVNTLKHAFKSDSSYAVAASALRSLVKIDSANQNMYLKEAIQRDSHGEIIRRTALELLSKRNDEDALNTIFSQTKYGVNQDIRVHAIKILASVWRERDDVFYNILKMIHDPNFAVRRAVISSLGEIGDLRAFEPLKKILDEEQDSRVINDINNAIQKIKRMNKINN